MQRVWEVVWHWLFYGVIILGGCSALFAAFFVWLAKRFGGSSSDENS